MIPGRNNPLDSLASTDSENLSEAKILQQEVARMLELPSQEALDYALCILSVRAAVFGIVALAESDGEPVSDRMIDTLNSILPALYLRAQSRPSQESIPDGLIQ